ncbi:hypothetical protein QM012_005771 [Aureobasidium pullulans]|uniref:Uncharacterized protein n=1 Tax=Aureobasidium pullulans TaxID=5580 RepID=A0ABR0TQN9_AURPU
MSSQDSAVATSKEHRNGTSTSNTGTSTTETAKKAEKYHCACGKPGYNNSHNTQQCRLRQRLANDPGHPANPLQKMFRQEVARLAKKEIDAAKAEDARKRKEKEKSKTGNLAGYSNGELKELFEELEERLQEVKKEINSRGFR